VLVFATGLQRELSLATLIRHRAEIDAFVAERPLAAFVGFVALYIGVVALSIPGAALLTVSGGLLFGPLAGSLGAFIGATTGACLIFLIARSALGGWLVNIAPALFGVRLAVFVGATALGIIPLTFAFALFGAGLDSAIAAQASAYRACLAAGREPCTIDFDLRLALTPELIAALAVVGVVALVPLAVKRWRAARGRNVA
jgi:uncharacterized membrane protein YdjX (TVP38/TMEM64 family)